MTYTTFQVQFQLPTEPQELSIPQCPPSFQTHPVDFLYCLPCELVPDILQHFPIKELFECMDVSQTWRDRIQNSPSLWHDISIMRDDANLVSQLSVVDKYIRAYHSYYASEKALSATIGLIHSGRLNQLKSLAIHEEQDGAHFSGDDVLRTLRLLQLTELTLTFCGRESSDWPLWPTILSECPGLERLRVDMPCTDTTFNGNIPNGSKLTHLSWSGGPSITPLEIETVLVACPQLIYLKLGCQDPLPLLSIRRQCPSSMRYLGLSTGKCDAFDTYWNDTPAATPGLRALAVTCVPENWLDLCQIIWADKIQDLTIFHNDTLFDVSSLLKLYHGDYLRLQHTRQLYQYQSAIRARVTIGNKTQEVTSTFCRSYMDQCPWFITSLRSAVDPQHTLLELEFTQCFIDSSLLPLLEPLLPCVRELHTINCVMNSAALAGLVSGLGAMERPQPMHHVRFSSIPGLTDSLVHQLAAIDGLQHVTLSYCDAVTDEGVRYLVDHSEYLEELDVRGCKWVSGETESYIQQKLEYRHHHHLPLF